MFPVAADVVNVVGAYAGSGVNNETPDASVIVTDPRVVMMKFFELTPVMKAAAAEKIVLNDPVTSMPPPFELITVENVELAPREYILTPLIMTPKLLPVPPLVISIFCPVPKKL
jgi:hypothetical protein